MLPGGGGRGKDCKEIKTAWTQKHFAHILNRFTHSQLHCSIFIASILPPTLGDTKLRFLQRFKHWKPKFPLPTPKRLQLSGTVGYRQASRSGRADLKAAEHQPCSRRAVVRPPKFTPANTQLSSAKGPAGCGRPQGCTWNRPPSHRRPDLRQIASF